MKLKILQIVHALHIGGAERVVVGIASSLDRGRFDVEVLCVNGLGVLAQELGRLGVRVTRAGEGARGRWSRLSALRAAIVRSDADVVHTHGTAALLNVGLVRVLGALPPWIHTFHFGNYPHVGWKYLLGERVFSRLPSRLVAVSDHQRDAVIRCLDAAAARIETIVNGVGENPHVDDGSARARVRTEWGVADDEVLVGCIAVLSRQKGIPDLLRAVRRLVATHPHARFVIIGGGPLEQTLRAQAHSLGLGAALRFTGWRSDALAILPALDVFVLPSLWEGLPVVVLEAMAARRAIVVTDVGDNRKVIEHGVSGLLVPPADADALASALGRLIDDASLRERLAANAYQAFRRRFTIGGMVRRYEQVYRRVTEERGKPIKPRARTSES